jgi:hypothetical protein
MSALDPPSRRPKPWGECPPAARAAVRGLFTDIDDTLTQGGQIEPVALAALQRARAADVPVIAVTGRPMGWSRPFARDWPVAAIVAENGAVMLHAAAGEADGVRVSYAQDATTRDANARRLQACAQRILHALPHARLATDSAGRVTDIAVDHAEHARLESDDIARVVAMMQADGLTATVSSIHVNGWIGAHDKWSGAAWALQQLQGRALATDVAQWVYVGDSTNDQVMFRRFPLSVGVANLLDFADRLEHWPAYLTRSARGAGFAEVVDGLLAVRLRA